MAASRKKPARPAPVRTRLSAYLPDDEVPCEFRIFAFGENPSEKGTFLFDQEAAASVMEQYAAHGKPMLLDFNHGTTFKEPTPEMAIAAGEFIPAVRADGLWATGIKWTDRARALIAAREYRLFSPFFERDPETNRVTRLINVALTNLPALDGIAPLMAANATDTEEDDDMDEEMKNKLAALQAEVARLTAKLTSTEEECAALRAQVTASAPAVSLRKVVLSMTGKDNDDAAVGVLEALRASHDKATALERELGEIKTAKLTAEFSAALDGAVKDGKIAPAQKAFWEGIAKEDGLEKATVRLRAFVETAVKLTGGEHQPAAADHAVSQAETDMQIKLGWSPEKRAAFQKSRNEGRV